MSHAAAGSRRRARGFSTISPITTTFARTKDWAAWCPRIASLAPRARCAARWKAALARNELALAVGEKLRKPVFLAGQIGDEPVSMHGERGKLVIATPRGGPARDRPR